jgi:hypothetical protein
LTIDGVLPAQMHQIKRQNNTMKDIITYFHYPD